MSNINVHTIESDTLSNSFRSLRKGELLRDEQAVAAFLEDHYPHLKSRFASSLVKGRQGILNRLVASMLREDILGLNSNSYDLYVKEGIHVLNVPAINNEWQKIIEALHTFGIEGNKVYKLYHLYSNDYLVMPVSTTYAFNRVEVDGRILHLSNGVVRVIEQSVQFLHLMKDKDAAFYKKSSGWLKLADELTNGSANLTMSYAYWEQKKQTLQQKASELGITNIVDWVRLQKKQDPTFNSSLFFEQLCVEGHNLHPGTKTKMGLNPTEVFHYAPEFDGVPDIQFVAVRKDYAEWSTLDHNKDPNAFLFNAYPKLQVTAEKQFTQQGLDICDYVIIPVHPWQLKRAIPVIYNEEIKNKAVVPISSIKIPCGATSSFRTVVPFTNNCAIKVAINSQMTSTVRSISANTTNNATVFTKLMRQIMMNEHDILATFVPVCECAGFNFKMKEFTANKDTRNLKSRNLSALFRENVENFIAEGEVAIVSSSLFAESPITEQPIFVDLIEKYMENRTISSLKNAAFQFFEDYLQTSLPGYLTMMVKYGIGLEGHLQNSVMVFNNGRPIRMLFRDWGGARIYRERLEEQGFHADFYPGSMTLTDNVKDMHNKVFYTVIQNHCGELILQFCKHFEFKEVELWKVIYEICDNVFTQLETKEQYTENVRIDKTALYQRNVDHKALTRMRLQPESNEYAYVSVANPLHQFTMQDKVQWHK
ncbi:IucA/IucC family protein [Bacillus sp. SCS-151]|uniref:IucA/IucC family protein n=1 Tax=Nanhaiella sioensis TaxID=3115293 RepID=UPI00397D49FE